MDELTGMMTLPALIVAGLLVANLVVTVAVMALGGWQAWTIRRRADAHREPPMMSDDPAVVPFVSVHVATHDEPPAMVITTLRALAALDWPAFEVIVIDNNTPDPAVWRPVEAACIALGPRFRFLHRDGVTGAKAGALNIALDITSSRASYVAVVDADYRVSPDFLRRAVAACSDAGTHFVQFPQHYRAIDQAPSVGRELAGYFRLFPAAANRWSASLLTGTLSLLRADALRSIGGWPTASITEDAEIGVALWRAGAQGRYVDHHVGQGMLPLDYAGLRVQRERWVAGNIQVLGRLLRGGARHGTGLSAVVAQLTAWPAFLGLPALVLGAAAAARVTGVPGLVDDRVMTLATVSLWTAMIAVMLRGVSQGGIRVAGVKVALWWTSSLAWWPILWGSRPRFRRTPKQQGDPLDMAGGSHAPGDARLELDQLCSVGCLIAAAVHALWGDVAAAGALLVAASSLMTVPLVDRALRRAAGVGAPTTDGLADDGGGCPAPLPRVAA